MQRDTCSATGGTRNHVQLRVRIHTRETSQRAQRSKKFEISIEIEDFDREWNFRASHPPRPYFCGEIETSRLKFSSEIKNFDRDWKFRSRSNVFDRWALWVLGRRIRIQEMSKDRQELEMCRNSRCVIAQAFCSQKSFREITLNYARLP